MDESTQPADLLPCPFCGGRAKMFNPAAGVFHVGCGTCDAGIQRYSIRPYVLEQWNARQDTPLLLPCLLCNSSDVGVRNASPDSHIVACDNCGKLGEEMSTEQDAITAWNTRRVDSTVQRNDSVAPVYSMRVVLRHTEVEVSGPELAKVRVAFYELLDRSKVS